jgi:uncharacterized protein Yka (UPF0111/DUF47 family)
MSKYRDGCKRVSNLKNMKVIKESCSRINKLENKSDNVYNKAVFEIFENETDAKILLNIKRFICFRISYRQM